MNRLPFKSCTICQKAWADVDGQRIVSCTAGGILIYPDSQGQSLKHFNCLCQTIKLEGRFNELSLVAWGNCWSDESMKMAADIVAKGFRPWLCQKCLKYALCRACGTPLVDVPGAEYLKNNGNIVYVPVLPAKIGCCDFFCLHEEAYNPEPV